jgi:phosphonate transport system ATP-binding protein
MKAEPILVVQHVSKSFGNVHVLDDVSFSLSRGEMVGLIGASGSGKSTLIRTIAALTPIDRDPNNGTPSAIRLFDQAIQQNGAITRAASGLRSRVGVVFQQFNLVPRLSVLMNVCLGLLGRMSVIPATFGYFTQDQKVRAMNALKRVGIAEHALKRGSQLSDNSSAPRLRAHWCRTRKSSSPTNPSPRSIRVRRVASWTFSPT